MDFGDAHFAIMQLGSEITLQEHPAYGQHVSLYNTQLLGCKALTVQCMQVNHNCRQVMHNHQ